MHPTSSAMSCALCARRKRLFSSWHNEGGVHLCSQCWPHLHPTAEWFEERLAVLEGCIAGALKKKISLFKLLGRCQSHVKVADGEWLTERVIEHLSLPAGDITFEFATLEGKTAGEVQTAATGYTVRMSRELEDNFRALSAILIHELMHIYLNSHGVFYKKHEEYEEVTDLACVLMGFGIPMVNAKRACQVDRTVLGDPDWAMYYVIGYLTDEQIGYCVGSFLAQNEIDISNIRSEVDPHCWRIVTDGIALEKRSRDRVAARRKAREFLADQVVTREICNFSCPVCFQKMGIPRQTIERIGVLKTECAECGCVIHFDGQRIIKFMESIG